MDFLPGSRLSEVYRLMARMRSWQLRILGVDRPVDSLAVVEPQRALSRLALIGKSILRSLVSTLRIIDFVEYVGDGKEEVRVSGRDRLGAPADCRANEIKSSVTALGGQVPRERNRHSTATASHFQDIFIRLELPQPHKVSKEFPTNFFVPSGASTPYQFNSSSGNP